MEYAILWEGKPEATDPNILGAFKTVDGNIVEANLTQIHYGDDPDVWQQRKQEGMRNPKGLWAIEAAKAENAQDLFLDFVKRFGGYNFSIDHYNQEEIDDGEFGEEQYQTAKQEVLESNEGKTFTFEMK